MSIPNQNSPSPAAPSPGEKARPQPRWVETVLEFSSSVKNGVINVIVHEGRVTQVERTERARFEREANDYEI